MRITPAQITRRLPGGTWTTVERPASSAQLGALFDPFGTVSVSEGFATPQGFANGVSRAVGGLTPEIRHNFSTSAPHVADSVAALSGVFDAVGSRAGGYLSGNEAQLVAQIVTDVATGLASIASELGGQVSAAVSGMGAAIPFLGEAISAVIQVIQAAGHPKIVPSEEAKIQRRWYDGCQAAWSRAQPGLPPAIVGTGPLGAVEPSDLFRAVLFSRPPAYMPRAGSGYVVDKGLPAGIAGIIVLLCGDAAAGFGYSAAGWAGDRGKIPGYNIPAGVRQSLWKCVQALMAAVRNPEQIGGPIVGDNGRSIMPMVAQILSDQWQRGNINRATIKWLADHRISSLRGRQIRVARDAPAAGSVAINVGPCSELGFDLAEVFFQFVRGWDTCVREAAACGIPPREHFAAPVAGELKLSALGSSKLLRAAGAIMSARQEAEQQAEQQKKGGGGAILALGAAGAAALVLRRLL